MPKKYLDREKKMLQSIHATRIPGEVIDRIKAVRRLHKSSRYEWEYYEEAIRNLLSALDDGETVEVVETTRHRNPTNLQIWIDADVAEGAIARAKSLGWSTSEFILTAVTRHLPQWQSDLPEDKVIPSSIIGRTT